MIQGSTTLSRPSGETFNDSSNQGVFRKEPQALAPDMLPFCASTAGTERESREQLADQ